MTVRALSMRQLVEGMALGFDASAGGPPRAVLELALTGEERGTYQLIIDGGSCRFEPGSVEPPTLRVETDAEIWRAVSESRVEAIAAVLDGRMKVTGDLGLFQLLPRLFRRVTPDDLRAAADQRPPGPVRLPAMAWLFIAMAPWKVFWVLAAVRGSESAVLTAFAVAALIWGSRELRGGSTFLERSTALVLGAASMAVVAGAPPPPGIVAESFLALAAIWAASLVHARHPLTAEYSRWKYVPRLWTTTLFRHPNLVLTLLWSGIFAALAILGAAGARGWIPQRAAGVAGLALCVAGGVFTRRHERGARHRRIEDIDAGVARLQTIARALLAVIAGGFLLVGDPRTLSGWLLLPAGVVVAALCRRARPEEAPRAGLELHPT